MTTRLGEPIFSGSAFLYPIMGGHDDLPPLVTLDEAITAHVAVVTETSESGAVPELAVANHSTCALFVLDGEQVIGVKQNRTFNLSMLLPPKSNTVVPVSCLESGRWSMRHGAVRAGEHVHFAQGRANKLRSVSESLMSGGNYSADQGRVWRDIDAKFDAACAMSPTSAEADFYEQRRERLQPHLSDFKPKPDQCGALVGVGKSIIGVDLFGSAALYDRLSSKLLKSYLLDTIEIEVKPEPPRLDEVQAKILSLFRGSDRRFPAPGIGETHRWSSAAGSGAALVADGRCLHAVAFCDA